MPERPEEDELLAFLEGGHESKPTSQVTAADGHTYYKSKSANASEAPTNTGTLDALDERLKAATAGLTTHESDFILMCQMYYDTYGVLIPSEVAVKRYGITEDIFNNMLASEPVQAALLVNKIIEPERTEEPLLPKGQVLSPLELVVCNTMLDLVDSRSDKKKLQDLNVSTIEWQRMQRKPKVQSYLQERAEVLLTGGQHEAALALMDRVRAGDLKSIQYLHEYTGKFSGSSSKPGTQVTINNGGPDLNFIVTSLIEIIIEEVHDPQVAAAIGDRVKQLMSAHKVAMQLSSAVEISDPGVAPMRVHTDTIEAIETRAGVGNA